MLLDIHNLNEDEKFYKAYQDAKQTPEQFESFLSSLKAKDCLFKNYIIPEIAETMPPCLKDEYFFSDHVHGMTVQRHNRYSPQFDHFHTFFEIIYVSEGSCRHKFRDITRLLRTGDICIVPPGAVHSVYAAENTVMFNLMVSEKIIRDTFQVPLFHRENPLSYFFMESLADLKHEKIILFHTNNDHDIRDIIYKMYLESYNRYSEYDSMLFSCFGMLFANICRFYMYTYELLGENEKNENRINKITDYIKLHYQTVSLSELSREFGYTCEYLSKLIRSETGKTFTDYVVEARMYQAVSLLSSTNLTVQEISSQVGYYNTENFNRMFRKTYQCSPSQYRKNTRVQPVR